ncbi:MAG: hypothetical protein AB8B51_00615 [Sedimentitalea sp.]
MVVAYVIMGSLTGLTLAIVSLLMGNPFWMALTVYASVGTVVALLSSTQVSRGQIAAQI